MPQQAALKMLAYSMGMALAISPQAGLAVVPPLGPPEYSAYGPLQICSDLYVVDVEEDEAVHIVGDIVRIINDRELLALKRVASPALDAAERKSDRVVLQTGLAAYQFTAPTPDPEKTLAYAPHSLQPGDVRYAVFGGSAGDAGGIIAGATSFDGTRQDQRMLERIRSAKNAAQGCIRPDTAASYDRSSPAWKAADNRSSHLASVYPPAPVRGPGYYCYGKLGFAVRNDENIRRPWRSLGAYGPVFVESAGATITIEGPSKQLKRIDPDNQDEHPLGQLGQHSLIYYPSRGIGPPYAADGVREEGSWSVALSAGQYRGVEIRFPASSKTNIGFGFLERLEFIDDGDPRCGNNGDPQ
jgi:hypothetical protein